MASSYYFALAPEGVGGFEIESLSSYFRRMAGVHGVTYHQLITHLRHWWDANNPKLPQLPRHCGAAKLHGYSADASATIDALHRATGLDGLSACTLLALRDVCAANGVGALKKNRAWCEACFAEAKRERKPSYDRLLWQLKGVERCPVHAIKLRTVCGSCSATQAHNSSGKSLDKCEICTLSLFDQPATSWIRDNRCSHSEANLTPIVDFVAKNPNHIFFHGAWESFATQILERTRGESRQNTERYFRTARSSPRQATLEKWLEMAAYCETPLLSILLDPVQAAAQSSVLPPINRLPKPRPRSPRSLKVLAECRRALKVALKPGDPHPSPGEVARSCGVSLGFLNYRFKDKVSMLTTLREIQVGREKFVVQTRVDSWIFSSLGCNLGLNKREFTLWIAQKADAPIHVVRHRVNEIFGHNLEFKKVLREVAGGMSPSSYPWSERWKREMALARRCTAIWAQRRKDS